MNKFQEAIVTINGLTLTTAQVMTLRVALSMFDGDCGSDDEHGRVMTQAYAQHKADLLGVMNRGATLTSSVEQK